MIKDVTMPHWRSVCKARLAVVKKRPQAMTDQHPHQLPRAADIGFFFSSRRRHTRLQGDWSSDVCSSDLTTGWPGSRKFELDTARETALKFREPFLRLHEVVPEQGVPMLRRGVIILRAEVGADRKSVVWGKSVDLGGRRIIKKKKNQTRDG